jgi:PIN domain nuclease of toxin-antitoxin system
VSAKTPERYVLDSFVVLAFLQGDPVAKRVGDIFATGEPWMTLVNLGEVTYVVERAHGKAVADSIFANLLADDRSNGGMPIRWVQVDESFVRRAASLKPIGGLSCADCFAAAAADLLGCPLLTGEPEFAVAEKAGIAVAWL